MISCDLWAYYKGRVIELGDIVAGTVSIMIGLDSQDVAKAVNRIIKLESSGMSICRGHK